MSTETLAQELAAGVTAQFGAGTNFLILSASGPVDIVAVQLGNSNKRIVLQGALEGFTYKGENDGGFDLLQVTSATDQPGFVIVIGDDDVSYPSTVTVSGQVSVTDVASAVSDIAKIETAFPNANYPLVAANPNRKRLVVFSDPGNLANKAIYLRQHGGANNIGFVVPGGSFEIKGTFAVDYFVTSGGADYLYVWEETE